MSMNVKTITVTGELINKGYQRISNLPDKIDKEIGDFLKDNPKIDRIVPYVNFNGPSDGGNALFLIFYEKTAKGGK